jgi:hypothetical protein
MVYLSKGLRRSVSMVPRRRRDSNISISRLLLE